ncbi:hypothetical protein [Sunxiuqinia sp. sy24]|uniref:hypothetical protein n=1 Tax=Sunxiuqinia sp. sy24 TaxID=3461495 RepID=UPI004045A01C
MWVFYGRNVDQKSETWITELNEKNPYYITISVILYFDKRLAFEGFVVGFGYGKYGLPKFIFYSPFFMGFVWRLFSQVLYR